MKKYARKIKANEGITLVALVITVIVMLILAGVVINLTIGDNGIFKKSDEGAEIYRNATDNEVARLNDVETEMGGLFNQYYEGNGVNEPTEPSPTSSIPIEKPGKPDADEIYTENSTINGGDDSAFNPEIPKGFKPVDVDEAVWGDGSTPPTEEAVKKGLVIKDEEGNQFVWIAVDGTEVKLGRYVFTSTGEIDESLSKTEPTDQLKASASDSHYFTEGLKEDTTDNAHARDIQAFRTSVESHGGYYIARYEASYGTDGKPNSKISIGTPSNMSGVSNAPTQEGQLWSNIVQQNAATVCQNMYDSNYGVTSDLVNSYAWSTAIVFIQKYSGDTDYSRQTSLNRELANTGTNGDERCHIHDMASNCVEWTTATCDDDNNCYVVNGGHYSNISAFYASRFWNKRNAAEYDVTFRPILYL